MLKVNVCGTETFNGLFRKHEKRGGGNPQASCPSFTFLGMFIFILVLSCKRAMRDFWILRPSLNVIP